MKISRTTTHYIIPAAAFAVCTAGILAGSASAANVTSGGSAQRRQQNEARYEQQLEKAVIAGKLTTAQEQELITEHKTLEAELQNADKANRKQVRKQVRQEAQTWAQQHNLDARWLGGGWRHHHRKN